MTSQKKYGSKGKIGGKKKRKRKQETLGSSKLLPLTQNKVMKPDNTIRI